MSGRPFKEGDWYCLKCADHQFAGNQKCRTCGEPRTFTEAENNVPELPDAVTFVTGFELDEDKKAMFLSLPPDKQKIVIAKGPLAGARDPTAVLVSRLNRLPMAEEVSNAPMGSCSGKVKSYNVHKGFGFIFAGEEGSPDIFLHIRNIVDGSTPLNGNLLSFDLEPAGRETGTEGQMKAVNVRGGTGMPPNPNGKGGKDGKDKGKGKGKGDGGYGKSAGWSDGWSDGPYGKGGTGHGRMMAGMMRDMFSGMMESMASRWVGGGGDGGWNSNDGGWKSNDDSGWSSSGGPTQWTFNASPW